MARASGAPIYTLHLAAERCWELHSWDRFQIPRPFSRIRGYWSGPTYVAAGTNPEQIEAQRLAMEQELTRLRRISIYAGDAQA